MKRLKKWVSKNPLYINVALVLFIVPLLIALIVGLCTNFTGTAIVVLWISGFLGGAMLLWAYLDGGLF